MEEPKTFKDLELYDKLNKIVLETTPKEPEHLEYFVFKKDTLDMVKDFLSRNNDGGIYYLDSLNRNRKIKFNRKRKNCVDYNEGKINVHYNKNLEDSFALVNLIYESYIRNKFFGNVIANVEEFRLYDYLSSSKLGDDATTQIKNNFYLNSLLAENAELELDLYKHYKENKGINYEFLRLKTAHYYANFKNDKSDLNIDTYGNYLIGYILSTYIYERLNNKDVSIEEYNNLKKSLSRFNVIYKKDLLKVLGLDIDISEENGLYISDDSIKVLSKTYKNEVNKFNAK